MSDVYVHFSQFSFPVRYSVVNFRLESHSLRFREVIYTDSNRTHHASGLIMRNPVGLFFSLFVVLFTIYRNYIV